MNGWIHIIFVKLENIDRPIIKPTNSTISSATETDNPINNLYRMKRNNI